MYIFQVDQIIHTNVIIICSMCIHTTHHTTPHHTTLGHSMKALVEEIKGLAPAPNNSECNKHTDFLWTFKKL